MTCTQLRKAATAILTSYKQIKKQRHSMLLDTLDIAKRITKHTHTLKVNITRKHILNANVYFETDSLKLYLSTVYMLCTAVINTNDWSHNRKLRGRTVRICSLSHFYERR